MKILLTALQPGGGIRSFFRYIYGQSCFEDCQFDLIAPEEQLSAYLAKYLPEDRIKVIAAESGLVRFLRQIRRAVSEGKYELIHSHGFSAGALTAFACIGMEQTHMMTAHDVFLDAQFRGPKGRAKHWVIAHAFSQLNAIHTVTKDAEANFRSFFPNIRSDRIKGILHGVDTDWFGDGKARNLRQELGLGSHIPLIGFFGRFMGQKGFRILVDALDEIRRRGRTEPAPHVVTFGWGGFIREDYSYLNNKGLGDCFHQMPQTDDMPGALKGVDMVVMPSRWEACGLLAMEALAAGVPLIGTNCIGLREILEKTPARVVPPADPIALASAIEAEIQTSSRSAIARYQSTAHKRFAIWRPAKALRTLYSELTSP